ncbi:MAG: hypothetical protein HQM05_17635 [Magnetococcales bacterium]|nr:hypothetical protein [Magnetococcales bacterium]
MIREPDKKQPSLPGFESPFERNLDPNNRWVKLAEVVPWEEFAAAYYSVMSVDQGTPAKPARCQVGIQVRLGLFFMGISMLISYVMMAPQDSVIPGFGLASQGLAWKMVLLQIVAVNTSTWFIARSLGIRWDWGYQVVGMAGCIALGWMAYLAAGLFDVDHSWMLLKMVGAGFLYLILVALLIYAAPWLACVTRADIDRLAGRLFGMARV